MPNPTRADVAARRVTTDSSSPNASQNDDVDDRDEQPDDDPQQLLRRRHDPEPEDPERRDHRDDDREDERDDREPGRELAVDHVVAVDRLREQPRQRPLGPLAVDRVEREGEAEQRRGEGDERLDRDVDLEDRDVDAELEQGEEQGRLAARLRGEGPELLAREEERDPDREAQDDQQDDEPDREQVVGELLVRDDRPARARDRPGAGPGRRLLGGVGRTGRRAPARRRRRACSRRSCHGSVGRRGPGDRAAVDVLEGRLDGADRDQRVVVVERSPG